MFVYIIDPTATHDNRLSILIKYIITYLYVVIYICSGKTFYNGALFIKSSTGSTFDGFALSNYVNNVLGNTSARNSNSDSATPI